MDGHGYYADVSLQRRDKLCEAVHVVNGYSAYVSVDDIGIDVESGYYAQAVVYQSGILYERSPEAAYAYHHGVVSSFESEEIL